MLRCQFYCCSYYSRAAQFKIPQFVAQHRQQPHPPPTHFAKNFSRYQNHNWASCSSSSSSHTSSSSLFDDQLSGDIRLARKDSPPRADAHSKFNIPIRTFLIMNMKLLIRNVNIHPTRRRTSLSPTQTHFPSLTTSVNKYPSNLPTLGPIICIPL